MLNEKDIKDYLNAGYPQPAYKPRITEKQVGGTHYQSLTPAPWDVITAWNLGYLDGTALKYIARWKNKNGIEDLKKAIHFLEKTIEVYEKKSDAV